MLGEIISAIVGNAIAKAVSRWAPARRAGEFANIPPETLRRRNKLLYYGVLVVAIVGFFAPYFFFARITNSEWAGVWFAGAIFGLPFSAMLIYIVTIWCGLGAERAREFIFYFEVNQKMNVHVFYVLGAPLSLLGFISLLALWR